MIEKELKKEIFPYIKGRWEEMARGLNEAGITPQRKKKYNTSMVKDIVNGVVKNDRDAEDWIIDFYLKKVEESKKRLERVRKAKEKIE